MKSRLTASGPHHPVAAARRADADGTPGATRPDTGPRAGAVSTRRPLLAVAALMGGLPHANGAFVTSRPPRAHRLQQQGLSGPAQAAGRFLALPLDQARPHGGALLAGPAGGAGAGSGPVEEYDDFGDRWLGEPASPSGQDPAALLALSRRADGLAQGLATGLAGLESSNAGQPGYGEKLEALASAALNLVALLGQSSSVESDLPSVSALGDSALARLDRLFTATGDYQARTSFLQRLALVFAREESTHALDSAGGRMLGELSNGILGEIRQTVQERLQSAAMVPMAMRAGFKPVLECWLKQHESQAARATAAGDHAQAADLLQKCTEGLLGPLRALNAGAMPGRDVSLHYGLLKAQIRAGSEESVGTLDTLYSMMIEHADDHPRRFSTDFPRAAFLADLDRAYTKFLDKLEQGMEMASLAHPIAKLYRAARAHGMYDDA